MMFYQADSHRVRAVYVATIALATYSCCVLATASQQQRHLQASGGSSSDGFSSSTSALKSLLMANNDGQQNQRNLDELAAYKQQEKHKYELKRRLHKLVDELVDSRLDDNEQQQTYPKQQLAKPFEVKRANGKMAMKPKKKRSDEQQQEELIANNLMSGSSVASEQQTDGDQKIVIIVKQRPTTFSSAPISFGQSIGEPESLVIPMKPGTVGESSSSSSQQAPIRRPEVDMREHARRILDDSFKIRAESQFTGASNHLGSKGGPKFGGEEEY